MSRPNKRTAAYLFQKAEELKKQLDSGKLSAAQAKKARVAYHNYRKRAKKRANEKPLIRAPEQGILPNFLNQLDMVHIEELITARIYNSVAEKLAQKLGVPVSEILKKAGGQ